MNPLIELSHTQLKQNLAEQTGETDKCIIIIIYVNTCILSVDREGRISVRVKFWNRLVNKLNLVDINTAYQTAEYL